MRNRFLMAGLLALGVAACGDNVEVISPTPPVVPPPPPVTATMAPASASVAVGNSVVFAVNASGGVAGEAASWTCSSSNTGIATVSSTSAGCQATGVVAGSVTITAAVSKSGESVNVGSELTVTSDEVVPGGSGDPAFVLVRDVTTDTEDGSFSGTLSVEVGVERGDQTLEQLSLLVDGEVVAYQSFGSTMGMAPPEDAAAEQAVHAFNFSFDSGEYGDDGTPLYMNGDHMISADLQIAGGMMADGMMGHETVSSNAVTVEFDNKDGVDVTADFPGNSAMNTETGELWYGGPDAGDFTITVAPVMYSGGAAVESVTLLGVEGCGADAVSDAEAPYEFTLECKESGPVTPEFSIAAGGDATTALTLNESIFPLNLDYVGPPAPYFVPYPNKREEGWVNLAVDFLGEQKTTNRDGWLDYNKDDSGVGGYTPQLRVSLTTPTIVDGALAAGPVVGVPALPPGTRKDAVCAVVTATDLLGNESKLPRAGASCATAASYKKFIDALDAAEDVEGDDAKAEAIAEAQGNIPAGIRAGLDVTAPTAELTASAPKASPAARALKEFQVRVVDDEDGSGLHTDPLLASIAIRTANNKTSCGKDDDALPGNDSVTGECKYDTDGYRFAGALVTTTGLLPIIDKTKTGYYTFSGYARDKAGNKSDAISRVALHDPTTPSLGIIGGNWDDGDSSYRVTITLTDDFSIRDYYVALDFADNQAYLPVTSGVFRVKAVEGVDGYDSAELTQSEILTKDVDAFRALQAVTGGTVAADIATTLQGTEAGAVVQARAQAGSYVSSPLGPVVVVDANLSAFVGDTDEAVNEDDDLDNAATKDIVENNGIRSFTALADTDAEVAVPATGGTAGDNDYDQDDTITLRAMVSGYERDFKAQIGTPGDDDASPVVVPSTDYAPEIAADLFANPFSRVDFYAEDNSTETDVATADLRLVASIPASSVNVESVAILEEDGTANTDRTDADSEVTWIYEIEVSAADFHDAVGAGTRNYGTPAARRQFVAVGVHESGNGVALVSPMVSISIED